MPRLSTTFDDYDAQALADYTARLPVELPQNLIGQPAANAITNLFTSVGDKPRFQTWPEVMVRSGATLPGDVVAGRIPMNLGLRREDYTDIPANAGDVGPNEELISRTQDLSGMAGGGFAAKPNALVAAAKSSEVAPVTALAKQNAPIFYSAVENAVKNSKTKTATGDQWLGEIRNQPGVKQEELDWVLHELPKGQISKSELEQFVNEHKVELKEVEKGNSNYYELRYKDTLPRRLEGFKDLPIKDETDVMTARQHNPQFAATVQGKSSSEVLKAFEEAKNLPSFNERSLFQKYDTLAGANAAIKYHGAEGHLEEPLMRSHNIETKYQGYQLPGGENYREMLLTLPKREQPQGITARELAKQIGDNWDDLGPNGRQRYTDAAERQNNTVNFTSSHWNEPNVLAHVRTNERVIPPVAGGRNQPLNSLHIEEIQSDWHQKGRKEGYKGEKEELQPKFDKIEEKILASNDESVMANPEIKDALKTAVDKKIITSDESKTYARYSQIENAGSPVPDAPFKSNWADLALKRIIRQAAETGKDSISWTPGEAQAARYDLSKQLKHIDYKKLSDGDIALAVVDKQGQHIPNIPYSVKPNKLEDYVGKDIANTILNNAKEENQRLSGEGLKIGGEGMKQFYDKMLVDKANAIVKKFGGKVEQGNLPFDTKKIKRDDVAPDEIAQAAHKVEWDRLVAKIRKRRENANDYDRKMSNEAWEQNNKDLRQLNQELDTLHEKGVSETIERMKQNTKGDTIYVLKITPQLRDAALEKGFSLFADTGKIGAPLAALTKVEHNPFTATSFHGSPNPLRGDKIENSGRYRIEGDGPFQVYDRGLGKHISEPFSTKEAAKDWLDKRVGTEFYSTPNPRLAGDYATQNPRATGHNITPLRLDTKDYHTVNAMGKTWDAINTDAIREANMLNKKGVVIRNVLDDSDPKNRTRGPQTVYITLDPSTVRSRFAKFDPAKFGESGLMKATGVPIITDKDGNQLDNNLKRLTKVTHRLIPVSHDPWAKQ